MPTGIWVMKKDYLVEELFGETDIGDVVSVAVKHADRHLQTR